MRPYDLTAEFSDGTRIERDSATPYEFVARSTRGKITWHRSESAARRAAGRGEIAHVTCSEERYNAWLRSHGAAPPCSTDFRSRLKATDNDGSTKHETND